MYYKNPGAYTARTVRSIYCGPEIRYVCYASFVQEILRKNAKNSLVDTISNPESAAPVCKICARMSLVLLALG